MKKIKLSFLVLSMVLIFSACGKNDAVTDRGTLSEEDKTSTGVAEIKAQSLPDDIAVLHEITSYTGDTDADGTDERVVLVTSAERDEKGEFLWNDGQQWALYVQDGAEDAYVLFNRFVQAGSVYFDVADYYLKDGAVPKILVTVSTGAGLSLKNYIFESEKAAYTEEVVFDTQSVTEGGINRRFSSIPAIEK
ncbi:MAG: hypothetical protein IJE62_05940 [Clostridia bacterium]|nr:hypothetical protein [Clostridia bacterium]